jgi:hypothetical protein
LKEVYNVKGILAPISDVHTISQRHLLSYLRVVFSASVSLKSHPSQLPFHRRL